MINRQLLSYPDQLVARLSKMEKQIDSVTRQSKNTVQVIKESKGQIGPTPEIKDISNEEIRRIVERSN